MKKILIGGSPCTHWSIAQKPENREKTAEGLGWELFKNYLIAKEKFKPDYFLYENNESISKEIQGEIERHLGVELLHFDSALVSGQKRQRIYGTNIKGVEPPEDRGIKVKNILQDGYKAENLIAETRFNGKDDTVDNNRIVRIGTIGKGRQGERVYSVNGKSSTLSANGGGRGAKTGLYLIGAAVRKLNVIEAERLQTLPDGYTKAIKDGQRYKAVGNGWTAEMIMHILSRMDIDKEEKVMVLSLYDGIGTGRYCLDKLGYKNITYYAYEIDENPITVALDNYPDIIECGDAFKVRENAWTVPPDSEAGNGNI